jgi:hypothetical protein
MRPRLGTAALFVLASCASVPSSEPLKLVLGTATPGGGFQVYAAAFAQGVHEADPTITIEQRPTKGSAENIPLLEEGKVDIALVAGEPAHEALSGIGRKPANLKVVAAMYATAGVFVVRADSPYRTIHDLKGKPIAWGARASGFIQSAGYMLEALGLDRDRDFQAFYLDQAGDSVAMLKDGRVAAIWGGGLGYPPFLAAAKDGARFIAPTEAETKLILAKQRHMKAATIPGGSYAGQPDAIVSVASWSFILARPDLPDGDAYRLARALHHAGPRLVERLPQARETTPTNTYGGVADPSLIHPGTMRYLKEIGLGK